METIKMIEKERLKVMQLSAVLTFDAWYPYVVGAKVTTQHREFSLCSSRDLV